LRGFPNFIAYSYHGWYPGIRLAVRFLRVTKDVHLPYYYHYSYRGDKYSGSTVDSRETSLVEEGLIREEVKSDE
jgi:hypothetical protein